MNRPTEAARDPANDFIEHVLDLAGVPTLAQIVTAVSAHQPSRDERHQLALMQAQVALDALQAGDVGAASVFLIDAIGHMKAMRDAPGGCQQNGRK